jgi:hypothetical protein
MVFGSIIGLGGNRHRWSTFILQHMSSAPRYFAMANRSAALPLRVLSSLGNKELAHETHNNRIWLRPFRCPALSHLHKLAVLTAPRAVPRH